MAVIIRSASSDNRLIDLHSKSPYSIIFRPITSGLFGPRVAVNSYIWSFTSPNNFPDSSSVFYVGSNCQLKHASSPVIGLTPVAADAAGTLTCHVGRDLFGLLGRVKGGDVVVVVEVLTYTAARSRSPS